jgi:hypothetical protein
MQARLIACMYVTTRTFQFKQLHVSRHLDQEFGHVQSRLISRSRDRSVGQSPPSLWWKHNVLMIETPQGLRGPLFIGREKTDLR